MSRQYQVAPSPKIQGQCRVPGDKSISHRSIMLGALAEGVTEVEGFLAGEDNLATLKAFEQMGVRIERLSDTHLKIHGVGFGGLKNPAQPLDMGNSGTAMRLMMGLLAGQGVSATLVGDESLSKRPMERVAKPLRLMGANIETAAGGTPPVKILASNQLKGVDYPMPMASAQVKSAIILGGLLCGETSRVVEPAPTRDHTERMLQGFGYDLREEDLGQGRKAVILPGVGRLQAMKIDVPADFSSAAFFMVAGLLSQGEGLLIEHVGLNPTRTGLLRMLELLGAQIQILNPSTMGGEPIADLWVKAGELKGYEVPPELVPLAIDELPVFSIAAAAAQGITTITGAEELRVKESDRIKTTVNMLRALGVQVDELEDGMRIYGVGGVFHPTGEVIDSHGDHRIAMSAVVAGVNSSKILHIDNVDNVNTSFPGFATLVVGLGWHLEVVHS